MRDRTFFTLVIGSFVAGLLLALSLTMTHGVSHQQPGTVALSTR